MKEKVPKSYPLDNSAIIHLASMRKGYTNSFRIAAALTETVCPEVLQTALDHITPRFPTIVAGIKRKLFQYVVVPVEVPPKVQKEQGCLSSMGKEEIKACAVRVICQIAEQLEEQTAGQYLSAMIAANVRSQNWLLFRILPLWAKDIIVQAVCHFYGERNSCLSISNLGEAICLEEIRQHIQGMDFMLTPRRNSSCNCGIISYGGRLFINFIGKGDEAGLERYFFRKLASMGCQAKIDSV